MKHTHAKRMRVLLIEEDRIDQLHFQRAVVQAHLPYEYTIVRSLQEAQHVLLLQQFDIIITDCYLNGSVAADIFQGYHSAPVIVVARRGNEDLVIQALEAGAADYLIKDPEHQYLRLLPLTIDRVISRWDAEQRLQQIQFDQHLAGIFTMFTDGRLSEANERMASMLGYPDRPALLSQFGVQQFVAGEFERMIGLLHDHGAIEGEEFTLYHADREQILTVQLSATHVLTSSGTFWIEGSLIDLSMAKQAKQHLEHERTLFIQRLHDQTIALRQSQDLAQQASLQRRRLISAVCGDLYQQLHHYLNSHPADPPQQQQADTMLLMLQSISVLTFQDPLPPSEIPLSESLATSMRQLEALAAQQGIHFQSQTSPLITGIHPVIVCLVATLLIRDAFTRTTTGSRVTFRLLAAQTGNQGGMLIEGPYTNLSMRSLVFGHHPDQPDQSQPNLMLIMARRLAELHGGTLTLESQPGKYLSVRVVFTQSHTLAPVIEIEQPLRPFVPSRAEREKPLLLLAEDNDDNAATFLEYLPLKYEVLRAHDGQEAILMNQAYQPDLIIMDVQMPVIDGFEAMRRIRANQQFAKLPIIAVTALAMSGDRARCLEAGATAYLSKPVRMRELLNTIEHELAQTNR